MGRSVSGANSTAASCERLENDVLDDLGQAESMRAVEAKIVAYPTSSGYVFSPGPESGKIKAMASPELSKYEDAIVWAVSEFGHRTASDPVIGLRARIRPGNRCGRSHRQPTHS
jgi:hypothetical protein